VKSSGRYIQRELFVRPAGHYRIIATDHDASGGSNGGSVCNFTAGWSDCVGNDGTRYRLKPASIAWFLKIAARQDTVPQRSNYASYLSIRGPHP
jgi:hypothetical protein